MIWPRSAPHYGDTVNPPRPGRAVLACRCGAMLDFADMCRPQRHPQPHPQRRPDRPYPMSPMRGADTGSLNVAVVVTELRHRCDGRAIGSGRVRPEDAWQPGLQRRSLFGLTGNTGPG
jgi:hypothetical protein